MTFAEVIQESGSNPYWLLAAVVFSLFAKDRRDAVLAAMLLAAGWLQYVAAWTQYAPHKALEGMTGLALEYQAVWSIFDATAILLFSTLGWMRNRWWPLALAALYFIQICGHVVSELGFSAPEPHLSALNHVFKVQCGVFLVIGGRGLLDAIAKCAAWAGRLRGLHHIRARMAFASQGVGHGC